MKNKKLLLIGKIPPPIGGVSIHVKRLSDSLVRNEVDFQLKNITKRNIFIFIFQIIFQRYIIHLHTSSPILRILLSIVNLINNNSVLIITYHGNIGRFNTFKNWMDKTSIRFADIPIVINEESLSIAKSLNKNSRLIPAFIPPIIEEKLPIYIENKLKSLKEKCSVIFCTNAFNMSFDKDRNEIYCGTQLINLFCKSENKKFGFIFSDPSGNYKKHIEKNSLQLNDNILLISESHSFFEILKYADCFIRNTTTDGDPLSVKEALFLNKIVFATNVIKRPEGVYKFTWSKINELQNLIYQIKDMKKGNKDCNIVNGAIEIINLYKELE